MKSIAEIDPNFKVENKCYEHLSFYNIGEAPFKIYGVFKENGTYRRMPEADSVRVSENVNLGCVSTAGGRVRFKTDSSVVAIKAQMWAIGKMPHFALTGSAGFDLYTDDIYRGTFMPPYDITDGYESSVNISGGKMQTVTINFPLYSGVYNLYIGLDKGAKIEAAEEYETAKPVVFYGSSITQGACASRPGNSYEAIISRSLNCDYINLGFSGNAKGETEMAEYISKLDMSVFVYDYDHNAPTVEHLNNTHKPFYEIVRKAHPNLPIIMLSRPIFHLTDEEKDRLKVIKETYDFAKNNGDNNVYLISGPELIEKQFIETATVDNCHPNDSGFVSMANSLIGVLKNIL